jgi:hypothetical protein
MLIVALPLARVVATEVYPPPDSVTDPVGVGLPVPPLTATVTVRDCAVVMLDAVGVTVTVGVVLAGVVTETVADPEALL